MNKMKFVKELLPLSALNPVTLSLDIVTETEAQVIAKDVYGNRATFLGIRSDGTVVRYIGQKENLEKLGFQIENGVIKLY